jgi:MFS family permease
MISELSTPATEARSFSLFAFTGALAIVLAPISGGFLVDPASRFKLLDVRLFRTYPYLLPPLVSGVFGGVLCLLCAIFVVETKPWDDGRGEQPEPVSRREIFRSPRVVTAFAANLLAYSLGTGHVTGKLFAILLDWSC